MASQREASTSNILHMTSNSGKTNLQEAPPGQALVQRQKPCEAVGQTVRVTVLRLPLLVMRAILPGASLRRSAVQQPVRHAQCDELLRGLQRTDHCGATGPLVSSQGPVSGQHAQAHIDECNELLVRLITGSRRPKLGVPLILSGSGHTN